MSRIIIVDTDRTASAPNQQQLFQAGYECQVLTCPEKALNFLSTELIDLVISEVNLPAVQGRAFIQRASQRFAMPIIAWSDFVHSEQRTQTYRLGADLCLTKSSNSNELLASVYAMLRRVSIEQQRKHLVSADMQFNQRLKRLPLTTTEMDLLNYLLQRSGDAVSKIELQQRVLQREYSPFDRNLDVHISNIRKKMIKTGLNMLLIKTVRGVGYRFELPK
ncbi:response regulator transcription factor [Motilimonas cestriensis]|uniref:Response regulator transcription factor n=1 Tax=Motilimonas cestriensis TaxID=2742685 RepID=A0ABS8W4A4_9GAMM|nr:response regulator transcription factor [Motilimonas cestriensis]MCE2593222.1 response regulator transcription factor [Motilimonas cestriensis]